MGSIRDLLLLAFLTFGLTACAALQWPKSDQPPKVNTKTLYLPSPGEEKQSASDEPSAVSDTLSFFAEMKQIPVKERKKQLSLAKARYEDDKNDTHRAEYVLALLAVGANNEKYLTTARQLVKEFDTRELSKQPGSNKFYALVELLNIAVQGNEASASEDKAAEYIRALDEKDEEIARLQEQINALKSIEQSIHKREVENITDGK